MKPLNIKTLNFSKLETQVGTRRHFKLKAARVRSDQTLPQVLNLLIQDVTGNEIDFGEAVQTEEQIAVGMKATVSPDGLPANGVYVFFDGTTLHFESGILKKITLPSENEKASADISKGLVALSAEIRFMARNCNRNFFKKILK